MRNLVLRTLTTWIGVAAFTLTLATPFGANAQEAGNALRFDPFPKGLHARVVANIWNTIPRYRKHLEMLGTWPDYMLSSYDLNQDGTEEIFARMSSPIEGWCDKKGITCLLHIYGTREGAPVELGRMMAGAQVIPLPTDKNGFRDLLIKNAKDGFDLYRFDGTIYQPVKGR